DPAARPKSDRNVRNQVLADRIPEQGIQLFLRVFDTAPPNLSWRPPIRMESYFSVDPFKQVSRRKLLNPFDHGVRSRNVVQPQKTIQTIDIDLAVDCRIFKYGFDFGSKKNVASREIEVERLDSHAVSRKDETFLGPGPNRQSKHPSQPGKALGIPFTKCLQDDFGITCRNEPVADGPK